MRGCPSEQVVQERPRILDAVVQHQGEASSCGMALRAGAAGSGDNMGEHVWGSALGALRALGRHHLVGEDKDLEEACTLALGAFEPCQENTFQLVVAYQGDIASAACRDQAYMLQEGLAEACLASWADQDNRRGDSTYIRPRRLHHVQLLEQRSLLRKMGEG